MSSIEGSDAAPSSGSWWDGLSRRAFLRRGALTAGAVGMVGSIPGLAGLLTAGASDAPAVESGATQADGDLGALSEPLLAHVKDLGTGEISLFQGEQETVLRNPALARQLFAAVHR
jgi:hypothetical protein